MGDVRYCPAEQLAKAFKKLKAGNTLSFTEEYAVENLYHEYVHFMSDPRIHQFVEIENVINETATQLYAREKYVKVLDYFKVAPINFNEIKFNGLGYKFQCNILRPAFCVGEDYDMRLLEKFAKETYTKEEYDLFRSKNKELMRFLRK